MWAGIFKAVFGDIAAGARQNRRMKNEDKALDKNFERDYAEQEDKLARTKTANERKRNINNKRYENDEFASKERIKGAKQNTNTKLGDSRLNSIEAYKDEKNNNAISMANANTNKTKRWGL